MGDAKFWKGPSNYYANHRHKIGGTRQLNALDAAASITGGHDDRFPSLYP